MKPSLSPLYRGRYRVLRQSEKFVVLQIGDKTDSLSVDRLKPVVSAVPVTPAVPPPQGHPCWVPASVTRPPDPGHLPVKKVRFFVPGSAMKLHQDPHRTVQGSLPLYAVLRPHLLGQVICGYYNDLPSSSVLQTDESFSGKEQICLAQLGSRL